MTRKITLSFDNGPTPGVTDPVLDVLAAAGVLSSFFVVGDRLRDPAAMDLARRAHAEGHWIGNHTTTHEVLFGSTGTAGLVEKEIDVAQSLIGDLSHPDRLFRPYAGGGILDRRVFSSQAVSHLLNGRYTCVMWNSIVRDWEEPERWVDIAMEHASQQDWTLTVLHDIDTGAMSHLSRFLDRLASAEIEIVQEFPEDCVPILRGGQRTPLDDLMPEPVGRL